jgi:hypothetical protein
MRTIMGVIKNRHGVHCARKKVPPELAEAVARVTGSTRTRKSWLQRSLRTKDAREANNLAKPVLIEFDQILTKAKALTGPRRLRAELSDGEIKRMADFFYASILEEDDLTRSEDDSKKLYQSIYLYQSVRTFHNLEPVDPTSVVDRSETYPLPDILDPSNKQFPCPVEIVEWRIKTPRRTFFAMQTASPWMILRRVSKRRGSSSRRT